MSNHDSGWRSNGATKAARSKGEGKITLLNVKPAVGFTLPSAGVTPAPSDRKSQNGEDAILLSGSFFGAIQLFLCPSVLVSSERSENPSSFITLPITLPFASR